tara:strand:- start:5476 stop:6513 length:1038 start_codon:yes stop_codon:yes gene_type:complete
MSFKLKNPLKTPLKQNHPQEQFGPQLPNNLDPRDLLAPPAPQYSTVFPKFDDEGYSKGNVDGKRIIRFNRSSTTNQPRESRYEHREFSGFPDARKPIDVANLNEAQRRFYERYTDPEVRKKLKEQGIFGTGEAVTDADIDNMLSATLNVPMIETEDVGKKDADATYTNYDNPTIIGGGKIRYRPNKAGRDVYNQFEELAHVALAHLQEPALREILGSPVDAGQNNPYAQSRGWLPYLNTPSELAANFYELRERINLKPNEQIESVEALEERLKQAKGVNWSSPGLQRGEDEILSIYDTPEEREKLLKALNTIASNEQKSPGITKWNQLSAKEMLTDIEQNKQMYS